MRKIKLVQHRWLCKKGHKHISKTKAAKCEKPKQPKEPKLRAPSGFVCSRDVRQMFWDADMLCSRAILGVLARAGSFRWWRSHPKGQLYIDRDDAQALVSQGRDPWQILGRKVLKRKPRPARGRRRCSVCGVEIMLTERGNLQPHGRGYGCQGGANFASVSSAEVRSAAQQP